MKNPWMSVWLSEYNRHAGAIRGESAAEASHQQQAMVKEGAEAMTAMWLKLWFPWLAREKRRRE